MVIENSSAWHTRECSDMVLVFANFDYLYLSSRYIEKLVSVTNLAIETALNCLSELNSKRISITFYITISRQLLISQSKFSVQCIVLGIRYGINAPFSPVSF